MTIRRIKGASGDLYNPKSKAHRMAINQLAELLREIGFAVECHKDETTARPRLPKETLAIPFVEPPLLFDDDDELLIVQSFRKAMERTEA